MLVVMFAIGSTDRLFALDSIPAMFGLTQDAYLVFTANAFALMGLRQLFFLLRGLLSKLVYLFNTLAVILGFVGVELVLHAREQPAVPQRRPAHLGPDRQNRRLALGHRRVPAITTIASLFAVRRNPALAQMPGTADDEVAVVHC
jgi:tellurite resistance protein TerC